MRSPDELVDGIRTGDRRALARAITLVESTRSDHREEALRVLDALLPDTGRAVRVGISGAPGVGKSTLIEALGLFLVDHGHRVAVLAVDPSSSRSGGSILGDKTRMGELANAPDVFIRPSPSGGTLGGVARRTRESMLLCEAFGFDVVLVETVGVGQSETAVDDLVDAFVLLVQPGAGDELQAIKRGVMELADVVVVTKTDGDLVSSARRTAAEYARAFRLLRPKYGEWQPRVLTTSATTAEGVDAVWTAVTEHQEVIKARGVLDDRRARQASAWFWSELTEYVVDRFRTDPRVASLLPDLERAVVDGITSPSDAVRAVASEHYQ